MINSRIKVLHEILKPRLVRWGAWAIGVIGAYDVISNQFPDWHLPKLGSLLPGWAAISGALLPWWGWLLVIQAIFVSALFEYVRKLALLARREGAVAHSLQNAEQVSDRQTWDAKGIYVGQMYVDLTKLVGELYIEIAMRVFNGSGAPIDIAMVDGNIRYFPNSGLNEADAKNLPTPQILFDRGNLFSSPDKQEILVVLGQRVPPDLAAELSKKIEDKETPCLSFDSLNVTARSANDLTLFVRLPLWNAATLHDTTGLNLGRVTVARLTSVVARLQAGEARTP